MSKRAWVRPAIVVLGGSSAALGNSGNAYTEGGHFTTPNKTASMVSCTYANMKGSAAGPS